MGDEEAQHEGRGHGARLTLVGVVAVALVVSGATWARPAPARASRAAAPPARTEPPPVTTAVPTTATTTTTGVVRELPPAPRARPIPLLPSRTAPVLSRLPIAERVIFLGIDDGMVRNPAVLDLLGRQRIPFTVFLTAGPAEEDPGFWRRAVAAGGVIESHTLTHPDLTGLSAAALRREVCGTLDRYQLLTGRRPTLFRPPYGSVNGAVARQAAECGYRAVILWKGSTNNGRLTMQEGPLHAGDIILLHWRDTLLDDIRDVIARCRQEGFTIGSLEAYLP